MKYGKGIIGWAAVAAVAMAALLLAAVPALAELSSTPREDTWVTNSGVSAIATTPTTTYIGGDFTYVGPNTGSFAALDAATGVPALPYAKVNDTVFACASDGAGGWYIGGTFTKVGTVPRNNIAHILPDGNLDPAWNPNAGGPVYALAVSGTTVYAGGSFTTIGGQTRNRIAALDAATGLATGWNPNPNGTVDVLAVSGTTVYAGGIFTTIGGQTRNRIAALDTTTGAVTAWNPNASGSVYALAVSGTTVYAGGYFTTIGGQTRNGIAALSVTTGLATAWNPNTNGTLVCALAVSGTTLYAGGGFSSIGGQTRNHLAALDAATGLLTAWNPNANSEVYALAVSGATVYAAGGFTTIGGQTRNGIAALDATTGLATGWNPSAGGTSPYVFALAVSGTTVYATGGFTTIGGQARQYIAALDATTGLATAWNPSTNGTVVALAVSGTTVYAGGTFTTIGGQMRNYIAALDATTGLATAWNPNADNWVFALAVSGTTVYAGGGFGTIGGQTRNHIAALSATTGSASAWNANASDRVSALVVSGTTVYAGGQFTSIGWQPRNYIAALSATTGVATAWNPNAGNWVEALAVSGTTLYAGGYFSSIGGQPRACFAQFDTPPAPPTPPSNAGATAIGTNTITWTWQDNSGDETGFKVYDDPGAGPPVRLQTTTAANAVSWQHTGLTPNTYYEFQVAATNANGDSAKTPRYFAWTLAAVTAAPLVTNPNLSTLDVTLVADTNSVGTLYAIQISPAVGGNSWVQADGHVGATPVYWSAAGWGTKTVTGLASATLYSFTVTARNWDGVNAAAGPAGTGTTQSPPTITITGDNPAGAECKAAYADAGATALSAAGADITASIVTTGLPVDTSAPGANTVTYAVTDPDTLAVASATRTVNVVDTVGPVFSGLPKSDSVCQSKSYALAQALAGVTAMDACVGDITANITVTAGISGVPQTFPITAVTIDPIVLFYSASDGNGNTATGSGTVVVSASAPPMINILGDNPASVECKAAYTDAGATATSSINGADLTSLIVTTGLPLDTNTPGVRTVTYSVTDPYDLSCGWTATFSRTVNVIDTTAPAFAGLPAGWTRAEGAVLTLDDVSSGVTAYDACAGDRTASIAITAVDGIAPVSFPITIAANRSYTIRYNVSDGNGNDAATVLRTVDVVDTTPPAAVMTLTTPSSTTADAVAFTVAFSEAVGTSFNDAAVNVVGTLAGTAVVTGTDPNYTVTVTPADPDADGTVGITVPAGVVADLAGNAYGGGSSELCTVYNWPGFAAQPQGARRYAGDDNILAVQVAEGGIPTTYQWKFNNGSIVADGPAAAEWPLAGVTAAQAGDYWCEVSFDGVPHVSDTARIDVQPHIDVTWPPGSGLSGTYEAGSSVTLTVVATGGYGPLSYQWLKDGENIPGANGAEYSLLNLTVGDRGAYSTEISDTNAETVETPGVTLTVVPSVSIPVAGVGGLVLLAAAMATAVAVGGSRRSGARRRV